MSTDSTLWTTRPVFGVAGGPDEVVLTQEGNDRAFAVGAQVRLGLPALALEALHGTGGKGHLVKRGEGARIHHTDLGRFDQVVWSYLRARGYVESFNDTEGDGVQLTSHGRAMALRGIEERDYLLARCKSEAIK